MLPSGGLLFGYRFEPDQISNHQDHDQYQEDLEGRDGGYDWGGSVP
jgi:hypothetical protein